MAIYKKITSATTEDLVTKVTTVGPSASGNISKLLIANYSDANAVTIDVFLEDAAASASTNVGNNKYYFINSLVLPVGTSLVLDDSLAFNSKTFNLRITTAGTSPLVSVIIT
jgi:hypothetical protein